MRAAGLAGLLFLGASASGLAQEPPFRWLNDLDAARAQAQDQGRPILAVFRCET